MTRPLLQTADPIGGHGGPPPTVLVPDGRVLLAARAVADSADVPILVATVRLSGGAGDTVALSLATAQEVLDSAGSRVRLYVGNGVVLRSLRFEAMLDGATVYRFARPDTVTLTVLLSRNVESAAAGPFRLLLSTSARLDDANRPWFREQEMTAAAGPPTKDCDLDAATGVCSSSTWSIAPYTDGTVFPGFQSGPGQGASSTITITFSAPIERVRVTIHDPTYAGNTLEGFDQNGLVGSIGFAFTGQPGNNAPDTQELVGVMTRVVLIPAPADYVTYEVTITPDSRPTLVLVCTPNPVIRGDDVTCNVRLSNNGKFTFFSGEIAAPAAGTPPSFFTGQSTQGGKSWETTGPALFSTTVDVSVTPTGGAPGEISGSVQLAVNPRTTFPALSFPSAPPPATEGSAPVFADTAQDGFYRFGVLRWSADVANMGSVPVLDATSGPFEQGWAVIGNISHIPLTVPLIELAPALFGHGGFYEDQDGVDSSGTIGRNGRPICDRAIRVGERAWVPIRSDMKESVRLRTRMSASTNASSSSKVRRTLSRPSYSQVQRPKQPSGREFSSRSTPGWRQRKHRTIPWMQLTRATQHWIQPQGAAWTSRTWNGEELSHHEYTHYGSARRIRCTWVAVPASRHSTGSGRSGACATTTSRLGVRGGATTRRVDVKSINGQRR